MMFDSVQPPKNLQQEPSYQHKSSFRIGLIFVMLMLLTAGIFVGSKIVIFAQKIFEGQDGGWSIKQLFIANDQILVGEEEKQIRILLLGIGGEQHEGGTLTDTMILMNLDLSEKNPRLALVSIPRDLLVFIPGYDYRKINTAYAYGQLANKGEGAEWARAAVERVTGEEIPYYGVIDFQGFKKVIDDLGGVKIFVDQEFTDSFFPDDKGRYLEPITFQAGWQKMDGERALQFVRSRHGTSNENTDFARSWRQQKVLRALKDEITSFRVLTNLNLIDQILEDLAPHIRTNLALHELKRLYNLGRGIKGENIYSLTIDLELGLVCNQVLEETGAYVLTPCAGLENYSAIRDYLANQFMVAKLQTEKATIEIQNASALALLGNRTANLLSSPTLKINTANFKGETVYSQSIIYDNTGGRKKETLNYLKEKLGIKVAASPFPFPTSTENPDFVIVVTGNISEKLP